MTLLNVCRFDQAGLVTGSNNHDGERPPGSSYGRETGHTSGYYNQFWENQNSGPNPDSFNNLNDYMLKTQIIPPVCPACPACPSSSACTNCGGQGGCGTLATSGNTVVSVVQSPSSPTIRAGGNSVGGVLNNTVDTAGDVVEKTVGAVGDVAGGVAVGAGALAGGVAAGAGSVLGGAEHAVGEVVGGAENIASSAITGVSNILSSGKGAIQTDEKQPGQNNRNSYLMTPGTQNQYNDPYSYYGQLPAKGPANFMPITADFSAFGR
jgi:hypothetical protein